MRVNHVPGRKPVKVWDGPGIKMDSKTIDQALNAADLGCVFRWVCLMPDAHVGIGATVGSVIPTKGAVIPAAVGVDIGCGMLAVPTDLAHSDLVGKLDQVYGQILEHVPVGRGKGKTGGTVLDPGSWQGDIPPMIMERWHNELRAGLDEILDEDPEIGRGKVPALVQAGNMLGTLGTGNHFIEVCLGSDGRAWIMLHSGSRGIGNRIARYWMTYARRLMDAYFINLVDKDLAFIPEADPGFEGYMRGVEWSQRYAWANREIMLEGVVQALACVFGSCTVEPEDIVHCHHNYVTREHHYGENVLVTRKGAVCAREGVRGIIPGSMGAKSFIVTGKGNPESFNSCSHGAGRVMGRKEAKRQLTLEDHKRDTFGVVCRKDAEVLDESPRAYKDIDAVMAAQADLVDIDLTLKQVVCVKG